MTVPLLTPGELEDLHQTYNEALPDLATIRNPTPVGNPEDVLYHVPCCVIRPTTTRLERGSTTSVERRVEWSITFPITARVLIKAEVLVENTGKRYRVTETTYPASHSHCIYAQVIEI